MSPDARREQLERAAIDLIGSGGLSAATAEAIAEAAGVSKGLLWRYYDNLDGLMIAAGRRAFAALESAVSVDVDLDAPATALFTSAIHRAASLPATHPAELRAIRAIGAAFRPDDGDAAARAAEYRALHRRQADLLRRCQERGDIRTDLDPDLLAITYQGMVDTMLDHLDADPTLDPAAHADHVAAVFLGGAASDVRP
ncbi:TetR/AcrR family transcriptional regulator [Williamsia sp. MIQD14]|uniref:TetR/AcrR family transcriptional regulator n=1 Tax=Williamsia sp. MIQD14 TaxID=3425703 RepID=UPI003DA168DA